MNKSSAFLSRDPLRFCQSVGDVHYFEEGQ